MPKKIRVYCYSCKYYKSWYAERQGTHEYCLARSAERYTHVGIETVYGDPRCFNKQNNCKLFAKKELSPLKKDKGFIWFYLPLLGIIIVGCFLGYLATKF